MTAAHIHLILNHIPILGSFFGIALLLLALSRRSDELSRVAFGVFVLAALFTIPVYLSGEPAEHVIEGAPGLSEAVIGPHETAAKIALLGSEVLGVLAVGVLLRYRRQVNVPRRLLQSMLALSLLIGASLAYTGWLGGQVRHTEVRTDFEGFGGKPQEPRKSD